MIKTPDNVCILTMPRSGSTSLMHQVHYNFEQLYGKENTVFLGEATGLQSIVTGGLKSGLAQEIEFDSPVGDILCEYVKWTIEDDNIVRRLHTGNPKEELSNRSSIIEDGAWKNHAVFKNMRIHNSSLTAGFDQSIVKNKNLHHIVLWRKDLYGMLCSKFILGVTKTAHGVYEWDGTPIGSMQDHFRIERFIINIDAIINSFFHAIKNVVPRNKTVMMETSAITPTSKIIWPDERSLVITAPKNLDRGNISYVLQSTNRLVSTKQMLDADVAKYLSTLAESYKRLYDWDNIGKNSGLYSYE
jgi:hypothetical protein